MSRPTGHEGECCWGCYDDEISGYPNFDPETCCCLDERDYDVQLAEYDAWRKAGFPDE